MLVYSIPSSEITEIVARDAFLESIRDRELSIKARERTKTTDEAYRMALRLGAYQQMANADDRLRQPNRERRELEIDVNQQLDTKIW